MAVFSNLQHFSKPSEVWVPVELLRSGAVLQARGLINSQAIQNNLDWVWPFWVEKQFNPKDKAFIPRAFSLTHINLTYRNWTAIGVPDCSDLPIVDPCGLITPFFDGWSVDVWILHDGHIFAPSRTVDVQQGLDMEDTVAVRTTARSGKFTLDSRVEVRMQEHPVCRVSLSARALHKAWLMVCIRPYNTEGISFIRDISRLETGYGWKINGKEEVHLDKKPFRYIFANYDSGDLCEKHSSVRFEDRDMRSIVCKTGMATSAALYPLEPGQTEKVSVSIPLPGVSHGSHSWKQHLADVCVLKVPDEKFQFLYDAAIRTMVLHSPGDIYPGPFTYKRFWFRDAAFILWSMMAAGLFENTEKSIDRFLERQTPTGYFMSQDGEWDSNGQAIWIMNRFADIQHGKIKEGWRKSVCRAAGWIKRKRRSSGTDALHKGLLPAGFSAEHFGPSDFYYWDDFWAVAGLRDASVLAHPLDPQLAEDFKKEADDLLNTIEESIAAAQKRLGRSGIPASPSRRMDAGAVGCLVASYPLQIYSDKDERILQTVRFLMDRYFLQGSFYHEISHSGINAYLSLHIAQVLLRADDPRFFDIVKSVADLASPTGQWPEAVHPRTRGGCMGDGQHVWASAEWVMMMHHMFVRHEQEDDMLILCSGLPLEWLKPKEVLFLGPARTVYGEISVTIKVMEEYTQIEWHPRWQRRKPKIEIRLAGHEHCLVSGDSTSVKLNRIEVSV